MSNNLNIKNDEITNGLTNLIVTYHSTPTDASNGTNPLPMPYVNTNTNEQVFVSVRDEFTGCISTTTLDITVLDNPVINTEDVYIDACDEDHDGFASFDLTSIVSDVLQGLTDVTVTFHETNEDALSGSNPIIDDTNYTNITSEEQTVYIRVENNTTGCYSVTQFSVIIHPLPVIDIEDQVICLDNLPLIVSANTNNPTDQYIWSTGETTPEITIPEIGTYWVTVTTQFGCENTRVFSVAESEAATIEATEIIDFSDPNNITVTISKQNPENE